MKYNGALAQEIGTYAVDSYPLLSLLKNNLGTAKIKATLMQKGIEDPVFDIYISFTKNITQTYVDGGSIWSNSQLETDWARIHKVEDNGIYATAQGETYFLPNDETDWMNKLIDSLSMEQVE